MKVVPDSERDSNKKIISKSYKSLTVKKKQVYYYIYRFYSYVTNGIDLT